MVALDKLLGIKAGSGAIDITGLTADSRAVSKGSLFAALPGVKFDGRAFIKDAVSSGAVAVLTTPDAEVDIDGVTFVTDMNPRRRYAEFAAKFFGAQPQHQVAVTGTNGKTSVADFTRQIWEFSGLKAASIGTLGVVSNAVNKPGGLTTPDPMYLHAALAELSAASVSHAALEASSHGLEQYRLDGVRLKAAAFTNLTRDHLDYHKTERNYFYAKARLFGELLTPGTTAVVNVGDKWGSVLEDITWGRGLETISIGRSDDAALQVFNHDVTASGQRARIIFGGTNYDIETSLIGEFQMSNALVAAGLAIATGIKPETAFEAIASLKGVAGRMEYLGTTPTGGKVYVDYAHTPDGLETVLKAALAHMPSALHVVFGCGGDRDAGKRPEMGAIAAKHADHVYVTDDNPRSENAGSIRSEIMAACPDAVEVNDRATAIEKAIAALSANEILIIAGKGHEEGQIIGDTTIEYSDIGTVKAILNRGER